MAVTVPNLWILDIHFSHYGNIVHLPCVSKIQHQKMDVDILSCHSWGSQRQCQRLQRVFLLWNVSLQSGSFKQTQRPRRCSWRWLRTNSHAKFVRSSLTSALWLFFALLSESANKPHHFNRLSPTCRQKTAGTTSPTTQQHL